MRAVVYGCRQEKPLSIKPVIYLILDTYYNEAATQNEIKPLENPWAGIAAIRFTGLNPNIILNEYTQRFESPAPYESGQFYKRELPCILALLAQVQDPYDVIIIDGFVFLDDDGKPGLGKYLYDALTCKRPVIGIAKRAFYSMGAHYAVYRGQSKQPLYVSCVAMSLAAARQAVLQMQGCHRLPDIVKRVDALSRQVV